MREESGNITMRYTGSGFELDASLEGVVDSDVAWADFDNDGDPDATITGRNASGTILTKVYENVNGTFVDSGIGLPGVADGEIAWLSQISSRSMPWSAWWSR